MLEIETRDGKVNSSNFISYLIGIPLNGEALPSGDISNFGKEIVVPVEFTKAMSEMYQNKRKGKLSGPTSEKRIKKFQSRLANEFLDGDETLFTAERQKNVNIEQARIIFLDEKGDIGFTKSSFGYGTEASFEKPRQESSESNGIPIVGIHTHPEDAIFSFNDYATLMVGDKKEGIRFLEAQIVLSDDIQLLAVATDDTPLFSNQEKVTQMVEESMEDLQNKKIETLREVLEYNKSLLEKKAAIELIANLRASFQGNEIAGNVLNDFDVLTNSSAIDEEIKRIENAVQNIEPLLTNRALIDFAKKIGVKLYFSRNMKNFKEFSA